MWVLEESFSPSPLILLSKGYKWVRDVGQLSNHFCDGFFLLHLEQFEPVHKNINFKFFNFVCSFVCYLECMPDMMCWWDRWHTIEFFLVQSIEESVHCFCIKVYIGPLVVVGMWLPVMCLNDISKFIVDRLQVNLHSALSVVVFGTIEQWWLLYGMFFLNCDDEKFIIISSILLWYQV